MKYLFSFTIALLTIFSCSDKLIEDLPHPQMIYTDLNGLEVKHGTHQLLDIDRNGTGDFIFGTTYIGDPILKQDEILFSVFSFIDSKLMTDDRNHSLLYTTGMRIGIAPMGHDWWEIAQVELAQKNIPENGPVYWEGDWRTADHHFLAVQIKKEGLTYNGWIELSFDTTGEKLVLHRMAVSRESGKAIHAGF